MSSPNSTVAMPTRASIAPLNQAKNLREALAHPELMDRIKASIPRHLSPERMLRVFVLAVQKAPKLAECDLWTVLGAMLSLASLGLEPNTPLGHAYLIPFEKRKKVGGDWVTDKVECNVVIGYRGYLDLMRRSGDMKAIHADVVYEGDEFSFEYGSNMHLKHIPQGTREGRKPMWAYAHVTLSDGQAFEVLPYVEIERIRDNSEGYKSAKRAQNNGRDSAYLKNPWVAFPHEMAAKTMIRRMSKVVPMSIEFANAAALDAMSEAGAANLASIGKAAVVDLTALEAPTDTPIDLNAQAQQQAQGEKAPVQAGEGEAAKPAQAAAQSEPAKPAEDSKPAQAEAPTASGWEIVDQYGEVFATGNSVDAWAAALNDRVSKAKEADKEMLLENNRDTAAMALDNPDATADTKRLLSALYGLVPPDALAVEMPMRNGKAHLAGYIEAFEEAIAKCGDKDALEAFLAANDATVKGLPGGTRLSVLKAIAGRKRALGIPVEGA